MSNLKVGSLESIPINNNHSSIPYKHLFVLVHGLYGEATVFREFRRELKKAFGESALIVRFIQKLILKKK